VPAPMRLELESMADSELTGDLSAARRMLETGFSAVLVKNGRILASEKGEGVKPLLLACRASGADARGSSLADKVVGVAAARVAIDVGVRAVYGHLVRKALRASCRMKGSLPSGAGWSRSYSTAPATVSAPWRQVHFTWGLVGYSL